MRAIETPKFQTPRRLQTRRSESRAWPERHVATATIKFASPPDGRAVRRTAVTNIPMPIRSSPRESFSRFWRLALIAWIPELARVNGDSP